MFHSKIVSLFSSLGLIASLVGMVLACGTSSARECLAGSPTPIFSPEDSTVIAHDFEATGQRSLETVAFANGLLIALEQQGCDTVRQEFTLAHDSLALDLPTFRGQARATFTQLSTLDPRLRLFSEYARLVASLPENISEGAPAILAPGLTLRIIRLPTPVKPSWQVTFEQDLASSVQGQ